MFCSTPLTVRNRFLLATDKVENAVQDNLKLYIDKASTASTEASMPVLKSLTFTTLPQPGANPTLDRRLRVIERLEEQKQLVADSNSLCQSCPPFRFRRSAQTSWPIAPNFAPSHKAKSLFSGFAWLMNRQVHGSAGTR
jgi:hypothetical protein